MPFLLNQIWKFIAPGMYENEKSLSFLLMLSSLILFYLGVLFTYFLVLPLVFSFFTAAAPDGILIMTDISRYLDFVLSMMFAFSIAFEIPVFIFLLIWSGISSSKKLKKQKTLRNHWLFHSWNACNSTWCYFAVITGHTCLDIIWIGYCDGQLIC